MDSSLSEAPEHGFASQTMRAPRMPGSSESALSPRRFFWRTES